MPSSPGPTTVNLVDSSEYIVEMASMRYPFTVFWTPEDSDAITVAYRVDSNAPWIVHGVYTGAGYDTLVAPVQALRFTRSSGTGTASTAGVR